MKEELLMKKPAIVIATIILSLSMTYFAVSQESPEQKAMRLVADGIAYINKVGEKSAFAEFTNVKGKFVDGEYYLFVVDFKGLTLAHGGNKLLVGKSLWELKDPNGFYFIQAFIKVAQEKGEGWVDYKWSNPTNKKIEAKTSFVKRMPEKDYFLGCGIYKK
jgi:cytochrome c